MFPSESIQLSLTARSRGAIQGRLRDDAGFACWGRRLLGAGLISKGRGFISVASNLVLSTIPGLYFLASDFLGVLFCVVVVGSGCCSC